MKYNKIILFFCIALPANMLLRMLQLVYTVETDTGFFRNEYKNVGYYLLILIIAVCAALAVICFTGHRNPEHPPETNGFISVSSVLLALAIGTELFAESFSGTVMKWQMTLLMLTGFASIVYLILYGVGGFVHFTLPPVCAVIPAVYFIMRIICSFISISSLALISDNVMLLSAYCVILLFFISYGKLYNNIDSECNFRKLMASGLVSVVLCFAQSVPHIIINLATANSYQHTPNASNFSLLITGIFIAAFTFSHFSLSNVAVRHKHRSNRADDQLYYKE